MLLGGCLNKKCNCTETCVDVKSKEPVCGSDMITYNSECELLKQSCETYENITILFYGDCKESLSIGICQGPSIDGLTNANVSLKVKEIKKKK